jgi:hypothetical protein
MGAEPALRQRVITSTLRERGVSHSRLRYQFRCRIELENTGFEHRTRCIEISVLMLSNCANRVVTGVQTPYTTLRTLFEHAHADSASEPLAALDGA